MRQWGSVRIWAVTEEYMAQWQCTHWQYTKRRGQITEICIHFTSHAHSLTGVQIACLFLKWPSNFKKRALLGWQDCRTSDMECYRHSEGLFSEQILHRIFKLPQWRTPAHDSSVRSLNHYSFMSKMCFKSAPACQSHVNIRFLQYIDLCLDHRIATAKIATECWPVPDHSCFFRE